MSSIELNEPQRRQLLSVARQSIEYGLAQGESLPVDPNRFDADLQTIRASFVTLKKNAGLRGCIGTLEACRSLVEDVARHAFAAAFQDYRFPALEKRELDAIHISISVLSRPEPMTVSNEADLLRQIRPGRDGLILQSGSHRGTFLPSVWSSLPDKAEFVRQLKRKAGLPESFWSDGLVISRYETLEFGEPE
ncbi:MAG: AmmeMemoRadiSam system protein A [Gammaproteobacteria bacterium]|nr:AmmeMemoRadiSam system protein A [Gammaproteobacteria bacterium]